MASVQSQTMRGLHSPPQRSVTAGNQAAVELLGMAKNRLNKFYNQTLYVAPPEETAGEEFFAQLVVHRAPVGQAPEMLSGEYKKTEPSDVVMMVRRVNEQKFKDKEVV